LGVLKSEALVRGELSVIRSEEQDGFWFRGSSDREHGEIDSGYSQI
jgi:hypothetical protein